MTHLLRSTLLVSCGLTSTLGMGSIASARTELPELRAAVSRFAHEEAEATHWKLNGVEVQELSRAQTGDQVEVVFELKVSHTLGYTSPEDVPLLKGEKSWLLAQGNTLDAVRRTAAEQELSYWHNQFLDYIQQPQQASQQLKVLAQLGEAGLIQTDSIRILVADPVGKYQPADDYLTGMASEEEVMKQGEQAMAAVLEAARTTPSATTALYNRTNAITYINKYTSATTKACSGGSAYQDPAKYNSAYGYYACNDCANYVSQALNAGGIPTTSTWKAGTSAWISVTSLKNYMVGTKAYWKSIGCSAAKNGDVITLSDSGGYYHTMMTVGNNGSSTLTYSAHTNDRLKSTISYTYSGLACWQVVY